MYRTQTMFKSLGRPCFVLCWIFFIATLCSSPQKVPALSLSLSLYLSSTTTLSHHRAITLGRFWETAHWLCQPAHTRVRFLVLFVPLGKNIDLCFIRACSPKLDRRWKKKYLKHTYKYIIGKDKVTGTKVMLRGWEKFVWESKLHFYYPLYFFFFWIII